MVQQDWVAVDFCYYAIFVEIHRTRLKSSFSPVVHRECLLFARRSLEAFHFLQQHPAEHQGFDDPYPSFLTWTLFLYPLSAFFVVFCNIIGTLDHGDYELLRQITERLSLFKRDPHIEKLLNLLQSLEQLCEPLFHEQSGDSLASEGISPHIAVAAAPAATSDRTADPITLGDFPPTASFDYSTAQSTESIANAQLDSSADWLMWQLFNSQVPAGWLNSGVDSLDV